MHVFAPVNRQLIPQRTFGFKQYDMRANGRDFLKRQTKRIALRNVLRKYLNLSVRQ